MILIQAVALDPSLDSAPTSWKELTQISAVFGQMLERSKSYPLTIRIHLNRTARGASNQWDRLLVHYPELLAPSRLGEFNFYGSSMATEGFSRLWEVLPSGSALSVLRVLRLDTTERIYPAHLLTARKPSLQELILGN
ncbi:hypothetical protein BDV98DRAFT_592376 [Pterulicium gracile]|uniref:Uncharacterized protein n=1 Tax=Pterulicium gracile TaxID=1884261 RepID=A0A5C3QMG7_9AGAR|nr:hypothetical protein BDV98DRAFT_592376 [Pterula gracilis]